jgi:hypothetical protein
LEVELERTVVVVMAGRTVTEERDSDWVRFSRIWVEMVEGKNAVAIGKR